MNANENKDSMQNQEAYNGIVGALLNNGMPKEIADYDKKAKEVMQEREQLKKHQEIFEGISSGFGRFNSSVNNLEQRLPILKPITMPVTIITKRVGNMFSVLDYTIEYQLNGEKGVAIRIFKDSIENIAFSVGVGASMSLAIATAIAGYFLSIPLIATGIAAFLVFSAGIAITNMVSTWLADKSKELINFVCEYASSITRKKDNMQNGIDYFMNLDLIQYFIRFIMFNNDEGNKILEDKLRDKYGDDEVDEMDSFEKDYRMLLGR